MSQIIRFGIVGVVATAIHYAIYYALLRYIDKNIAYTIGYFISFLCNFLLSSYYTFKVKPTWRRMVRFAGSHVANYFLQIILLNLFCWMGIPEKWAPLPVYAIAVPVNFLLVRLALVAKVNSDEG